MVDLTLDDEQRGFQQVAREFLAKEVVPYRRDWDRAESIDLALVPKLAEIGFLGLTVPQEYGGIGGDWITYCLGMEELGRADSSVRGLVSVSMGLCGKPILDYGTEEQKQHWLRRIVTGESIGCFGLTEPDNGSDPGSLKTKAVKDGDDYLLRGQKIFITNGTWADVCLVFARTSPDGPKGISAFLVPTNSPGFERREIKGKLGLRGQATAEIFLDEVRVPSSARLGDEGKGMSIAMSALDKGRVSVAAGCVGIAAGCLEEVVNYTTERKQFGKVIASYQLVQEMIADISVDTDAARLLTWRAAHLLEKGEPFKVEASKAKLFASETAVKSANLAIQAFGGYGYIDEYPVQKYLRDARVMTLYEGTSQIQKLLIGRAETGINAFTS
ncbi:acyl-CoA dehydrogenase [Yimella sp. RIT 621]|nr:acyl-CoA dehydrogenase family protein [Yimella sp. NH-Cas1]RYG78361.1 acyl-CoA dehydrogenase [Yimella sp. RIT 621]